MRRRIRSQPNPTQPVAPAGAAGSKSNSERFRANLKWVALAHLIAVALMIGTSFVVTKKTPPPVVLQLLPEGQLVRGDGGVPPLGDSDGEPAGGGAKPSVPEPPPLPQPEPEPPKPKAPEPPQPAPQPVEQKQTEPDPLPKPDPVSVSQQEPDPKPQPTPAPKAKPVKVQLKEVTRPSAVKDAPKPVQPSTTTTTKNSEKNKAASAKDKSASPATDHKEGDGQGPSTGISSGELRGRLKGRLGKAGVASATADGKSGVPGGTGTGDAAAYYSLIRDVYYNAWRQPVSVAAANKMSALLKIRISKNGSILAHEIARSSGSKEMDESVLAAARSVATIGTSLPDVLGSDFAEVTVEFEF